MSTKHTSGPWHISDPTFVGAWAGFNTYRGKCRGIYATGGDLEAVALVPKDYLLHDKDQDYEANAKLIAAAPDLLAALQRVKADPWYEELSDGTCEAVEQAINKAMS